MKKYFAIAVLATLSALSALAVPQGRYYDDRGNMKAIVDGGGKRVYIFGNDGYAKHDCTVISEDTDGTFTMKDEMTGITFTKNAYFYDGGELCLNLQPVYKTLTKE